MSDHAASLNKHYGHGDLSARILQRLESAGKDLDRLTRDDLTAFDEFHGGGRQSTRSLAKFAGVQAGMEVLDVGSGIGGPARTLAAEFACRVTGLDLTESFVGAAEMLTQRLGMQDVVSFHHGSALEMPLSDRCFDLVWSQNTLMNIEDKVRVFTEIYRVLKPGGVFAFEALLTSGSEEIHFPVFWASTPALSFLVTADRARALLVSTGFDEQSWDENTEHVTEVARKRIAAIEREGLPELGLGVIVPSDLLAKMRNGLRNCEEGRAIAVQAVYRRPLTQRSREPSPGRCSNNPEDESQ